MEYLRDLANELESYGLPTTEREILLAAVAGLDISVTQIIGPTGGAARWHTALSAESFVLKTPVNKLTKEELLKMAPHIKALAEAEDHEAHWKSVYARFSRKELKKEER